MSQLVTNSGGTVNGRHQTALSTFVSSYSQGIFSIAAAGFLMMPASLQHTKWAHSWPSAMPARCQTTRLLSRSMKPTSQLASGGIIRRDASWCVFVEPQVTCGAYVDAYVIHSSFVSSHAMHLFSARQMLLNTTAVRATQAEDFNSMSCHTPHIPRGSSPETSVPACVEVSRAKSTKLRPIVDSTMRRSRLQFSSGTTKDSSPWTRMDLLRRGGNATAELFRGTAGQQDHYKGESSSTH